MNILTPKAEVETTYKRIVDSLVKSTEEAKNAYEELNGVISKVKNVNSYNETLEKYDQGQTSFLDMLSETLSVAEDLGMSLEDAFNFDTMRPDAEAINEALDKAVEDLVAANGYSRTFAAQLKEAARAAQKTQQITETYEDVKGMTGKYDNYGRNKQLTYDEYNTMVSVSPDYAEAIEYVNGKLTINRDLYARITENLAENTAQLALQEAAWRKLKVEELNKKLARLTDTQSDEYKHTLKEIDKLKLEAKGYTVLANEISNATNQFERFRAALLIQNGLKRLFHSLNQMVARLSKSLIAGSDQVLTITRRQLVVICTRSGVTL